MNRLLASLFLIMLFICACDQGKTPLVNGVFLPDMELPNLAGDSIRLSDFNDKYVLVEFWASWCEPCRVKHSELNRIYLEYRDKKFTDANGFEIYYVNLDKKKSDWENAIKQDGIDAWPNHVADLVGMKKSALPDLFQFEQIPTAFLRAPDGRIVGKNLTEHQLFYELLYRLAPD